jgi:hypothetical protein
VFADEAGDLEFARKPNVSKYFIVCLIRTGSCDIGNELLELRRQLLWEKLPVRDYFHCSHDKQVIRDRAFKLISNMDIRIYAQVMEKSKAMPEYSRNHPRFYKLGWFYLLQYVNLAGRDDELMITAASIKTGTAQRVFNDSVNDAVQQTIPRNQWTTVFCQAAADPCLQIADYCTWAIQRKWESGKKDLRSYELIEDKIYYEYDFWGRGTKHYY